MDKMSEHFSMAVLMEVDTGMLRLSLIYWINYNILYAILKSF